jgi:hypothetical protein
MSADTWLNCGEKIHGLYRQLLSAGSSIMRVEDHLTMGIPGADAELEFTRETLLELLKEVDELLVSVYAPPV